ncbi:Sulfotransferase domain protein [Pseudoalteromonas sp. THAF3]|uniref:tetratricopeptide repeat-containing sulfotransferase family protein n=1 Tax=Pseudoalteromonas sp. THAF3 TaxID=2587843 RepID=UPI0012693A32|nr:tetratricopeptide repeat-containing sulfotransferase family protein [Pseudoalteromonas sp. THAF3]QFU03809.1 Sulfotransferase domain protein [Pseudoalteromonas sp. THAF3]
MSIKQQKIDKLWGKAQQEFNSKNYKPCTATIKKILKLNPNVIREVYYLLAEAQFQLGRYTEATQTLHRLLHVFKSPTSIELNLQARIALAQFNEVKAIELYEKAIALSGGSAANASRLALAELHKKGAWYDKVIELAKPALNEQGSYFSAAKLLIEAYLELGQKDNANMLAEQMLQRIRLDPSAINRAELVELFLHQGYLDKAEILLYQLNMPFTLEDRVAELLFLAHKGDYAQCKSKYEKIRRGDHAMVNYDMARVYDKLGDFQRAYELIQGAAKLHLQSRVQKPVQFNDALKQLKASLSRQHGPETSKSPVFIGGFPRSGTTLLDTVLDTQQQLYVLSESHALAQTINYMENTLGLSCETDLHKLTAEQIDELRGVYLDFARRYFGDENIQLEQIVDKSPYHTLLIPFIIVVFPRAKFITPIRHPFDVLLSCFKQNFAANRMNNLLLTLDSAVQLYSSVFALWLEFKEHAQQSFLEIKYEDLVQDFDNQMQQVFDFIGIEADDSYKEFDKFAREKKHVTSASKDQVTQKLYKGSINTWHNYADKLLPYAPQLESIAAHYGYSLSFDDK